MCLVWLRKIGLIVIERVALLSLKNVVCFMLETPRFTSKKFNQLISQVVTIPRYLASIKEHEIVDCFLEMQEIGESLGKKIQYLVMEQHEFG